MDKDNFPIEFNNEINEVKKSENEIYTLAVEQINKLVEGHEDISGAMVNLKQPAQGQSNIYEVTIVVYMGADHIAATEKNEQLKAALYGALNGVERQVRQFREQRRNY